jgi:TatD DNase family protein
VEGPAFEDHLTSGEGQALLEGAIDTHCHLFLMDGDPGQAVARAHADGVQRLICVGIDSATSHRSLELAQAFRGVFASAGVHPHTASGFDREAGSAIEELLGDPLVIAVGETGLDYYRRLSPVEDQHRAFRTHIALAREFDKPLVVHVREAWDDALRILAEEGATRVVLHCFTGDQALAKEACARGYFLSFAGNVTYPNAGVIRQAAMSAAADQVLVETDSPFLPPQHLRGQDNVPSNLMAGLSTIAEVRGIELQAMVETTSTNARRAFPHLR